MAKKFEYTSFGQNDLTNQRLKQLGAEGWEMTGVAVDGCSGNSSSTLYFKREIESPLMHKQERPIHETSRQKLPAVIGGREYSWLDGSGR